MLHHLAKASGATKFCLTYYQNIAKLLTHPSESSFFIELIVCLLQVDESCFNELPEDIQQEMCAAMKQREILKQDEAIALSAAKGDSSASSPIKMVVLRSPTKDSSPIKSRGVGQKRKSPGKTKKSPGKKWSPHFKVPRGRPRTRRGIGTRTMVDARKVKKKTFYVLTVA